MGLEGGGRAPSQHIGGRGHAQTKREGGKRKSRTSSRRTRKEALQKKAGPPYGYAADEIRKRYVRETSVSARR